MSSQEEKEANLELSQLVNELMDDQTNETDYQKDDYVDLNSLDLPSRHEAHKSASFRLAINWKHPIIRFIAMTIVLILVIITLIVIM